MVKQKKISGWDIWDGNFHNARRFFKSKGNIKTKSKLKDKWFKKFKFDIETAEIQIRKEVISKLKKE